METTGMNRDKRAMQGGKPMRKIKAAMKEITGQEEGLQAAGREDRETRLTLAEIAEREELFDAFTRGQLLKLVIKGIQGGPRMICWQCNLEIEPQHNCVKSLKAQVAKLQQGWEPDEFESHSHDLMNEVQGEITAAFERSGFDPCPAIKIAQEATEKAWMIWNRFVMERQRMKEEWEDKRNGFISTINAAGDLTARIAEENIRLRSELARVCDVIALHSVTHDDVLRIHDVLEDHTL